MESTTGSISTTISQFFFLFTISRGGSLFPKKIKEALVSFGRSIESSFEPVHTEMKYASLLPQIGISISQMRIKNIEEEINLNLESFLVSIQLWHRLAYFAVRKKIQALLSPVYKDLFKKMGKGYVKDSLEDLQKFFHENAVMLCKETEASVFSQLSDSTTLASKRFMLTIGKLSALEFPTIPISHISPPKGKLLVFSLCFSSNLFIHFDRIPL